MVIGAKTAGGGDRNENATGIFWVEENRVQTHAPCAGLPFGAGAMTTQAGQFVPGLSAVGGLEQGGVLDAGIDCFRVSERRFNMPDAFEFPRMGGAVVPHVGRDRFAGFGRDVINELVAFAFGEAFRRFGGLAGRGSRLFPGFASIAGALNNLAK